MVEALHELKHSIHTHMAVMAGPSSQLASFLIKTIDFLEDEDEDRKQNEMLALAFHIVEAIAIHVQDFISEHERKAIKQGYNFPPQAKQARDNLLIIVGKSRGMDDKVAAKNAVLRSISTALQELSVYTKSDYMKITDSNGQLL